MSLLATVLKHFIFVLPVIIVFDHVVLFQSNVSSFVNKICKADQYAFSSLGITRFHIFVNIRQVSVYLKSF